MPASPKPLRFEDCTQLRQAGVEIIVDQYVIVLAPMAHLVGGTVHAIADRLLAVGAAGSQAALQLHQRRRQDVDADDILRIARLQLLRALPVDVEQHVTALVHRLPNGASRRAVALAEDVRPLDQRMVGDELVEGFFIDEMIVDSVGLAGARRARRRGDGKRDAAVLGEDTAGHRGLARPRRRREHEQQAPAGVRHRVDERI